MVDGVVLESEDDVFARIIHEGSRRNCRDAKRDGCAEPRGRETYLKQYVDRSRGEPARRQACRSGVSAGAVEAVVNNAGYGVRGNQSLAAARRLSPHTTWRRAPWLHLLDVAVALKSVEVPRDCVWQWARKQD